MRVLLFGTYERGYPRNAQVAAALRRAGVEVTERHQPVWTGREQWRAGPRTAVRLLAAEARLALGPRADADAVLVGYPGHLDLPAARRVARGSPVVFNPLVALWDTLVEDRGRFRDGSVAARMLRRLDRWALRAADLVVADTQANAAHFAALGELERVESCLVGAEERLFTPGDATREPATALFVGKLIPLHGLETILTAARLRPQIRFRVVGDGQLRGLLDRRPPNVEHVPWVPYEDLPTELHRATCALGVFGTSAKAARVIPNKAFQALACATPLVTADTPAARELLVDGESALLVPPGDPDALAAAVSRACEDPGQLGAAGLAAYRKHASEEVLGRRWRRLIEDIL
ncbi:MAG TPA: glycosyltransferase [Gaiellaceae bacterium]|nr:glycosyltransferase [Gaiellaceae bacterium]